MNEKELALREKIISLHKKKKPTREIAYLLDISKSKAAFWVKRFNDTGNITNQPRSGRPTPLKNKELEEIKQLLKTKLLSSKSKAGTSSKEVLQLIEQKTNKKYCLRHAETIMHKMGLSLITPRIGHIRKDEETQEKFRGNFKKNFARSIWAFQS
jgi:transposase